MNILVWIIFGALTGWLASLIMGTDDQQGPIGNIVLGIVGAVVGGFLAGFLGQGGVTGFNIYSMVVAVLGAVVVVAVVKLFKRGV